MRHLIWVPVIIFLASAVYGANEYLKVHSAPPRPGEF